MHSPGSDVKPHKLDILDTPQTLSSPILSASGENVPVSASSTRNGRITVKRNYAELEDGSEEPSDEREYQPRPLIARRGRPRKGGPSRKRPMFSRPTIAASARAEAPEGDSDKVKGLFAGEFYDHYRPHWGGKKRRRKNEDLCPEEIIDDSDDKEAKEALLNELFSQDITHGYECDRDRLDCFLKVDRKGLYSPKRPLNVYFLYRMDIASLVDRFARLHKDPIRMNDQLFILLRECCQWIPHFKEGLYTGNAKTLACTRRWDELKANRPDKLKFFELLEQEYKELYTRLENFIDYHYNPNKEHTPPPQLFKRLNTSSPAKRSDRSTTGTPHPGEEEDGYIYPTASRHTATSTLAPGYRPGYPQQQYNLSPNLPPPMYPQYINGWEENQYPGPNNNIPPQYQPTYNGPYNGGLYLPHIPAMSTYQFPPPPPQSYYHEGNNFRGYSPESHEHFTPSPSDGLEDLVERPPTLEEMYDKERFYTEKLPLDGDEAVFGRRRSSARVSRLLQ